MQPILESFLEKWVYPTGFTGPGVDFRLRQTERCLPHWDKLVTQAIDSADKDLKSGNDEYKAIRARAGYAAEGPYMSLKQMSTQILQWRCTSSRSTSTFSACARGKSGTK